MTDRVLDIILNQAAVDANNYIGENMAEAEEVAFSKKYEKKMQRLFRRIKNRKIIKKFIIIAVLLLAVMALVVFAVEPLRIEFMNFAFSNSYHNERVSLKFVPDGLKLVEERITPNITFMNFENKATSEYLQFNMRSLRSNSSADTENATIEELKLNGIYDAIYISNPNVNILIWYDSENAFSLSGNISKEELIKIAENFEKN